MYGFRNGPFLSFPTNDPSLGRDSCLRSHGSWGHFRRRYCDVYLPESSSATGPSVLARSRRYVKTPLVLSSRIRFLSSFVSVGTTEGTSRAPYPSQVLSRVHGTVGPESPRGLWTVILCVTTHRGSGGRCWDSTVLPRRSSGATGSLPHTRSSVSHPTSPLLYGQGGSKSPSWHQEQSPWERGTVRGCENPVSPESTVTSTVEVCV